MAFERFEARPSAEVGARVERLVCHPRLPWVAALDAERPAVHVWDLADGEPRSAVTVDDGAPGYGDVPSWDQYLSQPSVAWHPHEPTLVVASRGDGLRSWSPAAGLARLHGLDAGYADVAVSPDGRTVWATPALDADDDADPGSIAVDLDSGAARRAPWWDTAISPHPGGRLALTFSSDQAETRALFVRVDGVVPRLLRRALVLDADGYEAPVFSPDGGLVAVRGDAYLNHVRVFAFPSLHDALAVVLGEQAQYHAWSRHNVAFAPDAPAALLVGTPDGTVVELDVATRRAVEHPVLPGRRVAALAVTAGGDLLVAAGDGALVSLRRPGVAWPPRGAAERVDAFLETAREVPDDDAGLELVDGAPAWLRLSDLVR
jgi:WD40 repeat protein